MLLYRLNIATWRVDVINRISTTNLLVFDLQTNDEQNFCGHKLQPETRWTNLNLIYQAQNTKLFTTLNDLTCHWGLWAQLHS